MKNISEYLNESLIIESNDLWKQYTYALKNMPKTIPFEDGEKVTEEMLVKHYSKYFEDPSKISYDDVNGLGLIPFEQYVISNWNDIRLLNMSLSFNHSSHTTTLTIEYGPKSTPRKSKGTVAKKEGHEFDITTEENKSVDAKKWVHSIVSFLNNNIVDLNK